MDWSKHSNSADIADRLSEIIISVAQTRNKEHPESPYGEEFRTELRKILEEEFGVPLDEDELFPNGDSTHKDEMLEYLERQLCRKM